MLIHRESSRVENGALRDRTVDLQLHLSTDVGERPEVRRELDADHDNVCTSTDRTAGRFCTIGCHVSPASADP